LSYIHYTYTKNDENKCRKPITVTVISTSKRFDSLVGWLKKFYFYFYYILNIRANN